jgi:hypothetical protein
MYNIRKIKFTYLLLIAIILNGCCSITGGEEQTLKVETDSGSKCSLSNNKGVWQLNNAPGSTTVQTDRGDLVVKCSNGLKNGTTTVKSSTKNMVYGNILVAGMLSTIVDYETGAAYEYPEVIKVPLS